MQGKDRNDDDKKANKKTLYLQVTGRDDGRSVFHQKEPGIEDQKAEILA